jgi:hypothetical protein
MTNTLADDELLDMSTSPVDAATFAAFSISPGVEGMTSVSVIVAVASEARVPREQVVPVQSPCEGEMESSVVPGGSTSVTVTSSQRPGRRW